MGKASKRQRRDAAQHSLKGKGAAAQETGLDLLLSDELKEQLLGSCGDGQPLLIVPGNKKKANGNEGNALQPSGAHGSQDPAAQPQASLSKSQLRKLKQIQMKKERRESMAQVMEQLNAHSLSEAQLALLRPLHQRGASATKRQRLRRALLLERAGVAPPEADAAELYRPRKPPAGTLSGEGSSSDDEDAPLTRANGRQILGHITPPLGSKTLAGATKPGGGSGAVIRTPAPVPSIAGPEAVTGGGDSDSDTTDAPDGRAGPPGGAASDTAAKRAALRAEAERARRLAGVAPGGGQDDEDPDDALVRRLQEQRAAAAAAEAAAVAAAGGASGRRHRLVVVKRAPQVEEARQGLPIIAMEQEVIEAVAAHDVVVLCGETGCGKTTQVPQFLLEAGYGCSSFPERAGRIGVTQPRRVAATSTAARVAHELGAELGGTVGYQVRYDRAVGDGTRIKFMTDGILLRELQSDFLLRGYSCLLVDEAHERSLNTDMLLGMLSRIVTLRRKLCTEQRARPGYQPDAPDAVHPLKLIIMSATLRTSDFLENRKLFASPPPVVEVPARQYPVTVHFSRRTETADYLTAAFRKVARIHRELPPGGVLVFLTGQREVEGLCRRLRTHFTLRSRASAPPPDAAPMGEGTEMDAEVNDAAAASEWGGGDLAEARGEEADGAPQGSRDDAAGADHDDDYADMNDSADEDEDDVEVLGGEGLTPEEIAAAEARFEAALGFSRPSLQPTVAGLEATVGEQDGPAPVHVLPLYALLPAAAQARVFDAPPPGHRLIVVATNVAETSLTIPGIRYVVDAGRSKQRILEDEGGGLARFEVRWVSQAAAAQRAGRAGRTGPGHCYRLYSSAHYNDAMPRHTPPEIANTSLEGVVLVLKSMGVDKVANFPFPSPPSPAALAAAEQCLVALSALHPTTRALTPVGAAMAAFPIGPRHARMLLEVVAWQARLEGAAVEAARAAGSRPPSAHLAAQALPYAIALAAALSAGSPFMSPDALDGEAAGGGGGPGGVGAGGPGTAARRAHGRIRLPGSDALSALRALCGYEAAPDPAAYAARHYLHAKALAEAAELHRQVLRVLSSPASVAAVPLEGPGVSLAAQLSAAVAGRGDEMVAVVAAGGDALPTAVQDALRRALAVGWADRVARRVRSAEYLARRAAAASEAGDAGRPHAAVRYISCALANAHTDGVDAGAAARAVAAAARSGLREDVSGDVFLPARSPLAAAAPEYVVYGDLVRTSKRPYMSGVTAVEPEWLVQGGTPLATWSAPLPDPAPLYKPPPVDAVLAWHDVTYGRHAWPLPRALRPHSKPRIAASVFAAALLDGKVLPAMQGVRSVLVSAPSVAAAPEMQAVARVGELVGRLAGERVASLARLAAVWSQKRFFLLAELVAWLPRAHHETFTKLWPKLLQQAAAAVGTDAVAKPAPKVAKRGAKPGVVPQPAPGAKKRAAAQVPRSNTELSPIKRTKKQKARAVP